MDSRKCQTSTVTPAKLGGFSFLFNVGFLSLHEEGGSVFHER